MNTIKIQFSDDVSPQEILSNAALRNGWQEFIDNPLFSPINPNEPPLIPNINILSFGQGIWQSRLDRFAADDKVFVLETGLKAARDLEDQTRIAMVEKAVKEAGTIITIEKT